MVEKDKKNIVEVKILKLIIKGISSKLYPVVCFVFVYKEKLHWLYNSNLLKKIKLSHQNFIFCVIEINFCNSLFKKYFNFV